MANNLLTIFQRLGNTISGDNTMNVKQTANSNFYQIKHNDIIDTATNPEEYRMKLLQAKQQTLLAKQWKKPIMILIINH